jgi:transposase
LCFDEARFGLHSWHKRRYRHRGERPSYIGQHRYEWSWLYAAVEPATGEHVCFYLSALDSVCFEVFLEHLSACYPEHHLVLVLDNAPAHHAKHVAVPENVSLVFLPPYSPELNPVERWFQEFRRALANRLFGSLTELHHALTDVLKRYCATPSTLQRLTNFPYWRDALALLCHH